VARRVKTKAEIHISETGRSWRRLSIQARGGTSPARTSLSDCWPLALRDHPSRVCQPTDTTQHLLSSGLGVPCRQQSHLLSPGAPTWPQKAPKEFAD
jgi:hypothetical protein